MAVYNIKPFNTVTSNTSYRILWWNPLISHPQVTLTHSVDLVVYFMRAWDTVNGQYVYWTTSSPSDLPLTTTPAMSSKNNLTNIAVVTDMM